VALVEDNLALLIAQKMTFDFGLNGSKDLRQDGGIQGFNQDVFKP
jgi:hypothetical protein